MPPILETGYVMKIDADAVLWSAPERERAGRPLLVLLHGYGSHEGDLFSLAPALPLSVGVGPGREPGYELGRELYFIYVKPEHRRGAIGKALLKHADADYLWIAEANRKTQAFYRKQRFFPDSVRRVGMLFGAELTEIRMAR